MMILFPRCCGFIQLLLLLEEVYGFHLQLGRSRCSNLRQHMVNVCIRPGIEPLAAPCLLEVLANVLVKQTLPTSVWEDLMPVAAVPL